MTIILENTIDTVFRSIAFRAFSYIRRLLHDTKYMHTLYLLHNNECSKGATVAQWLRCCATSRKVVGSIPDGVIAIFH